MSFRIYSIRSDIVLRMVRIRKELRYIVSDPVNQKFFRVSFIQFLLLKYFQAHPGTAAQGAKHLQTKCDVEIDESLVSGFMEKIREKALLVPDRKLNLSVNERVRFSKAVIAQIEGFIRKITRNGSIRISEESQGMASNVLLDLQHGDVISALENIRRYRKREDIDQRLREGIELIINDDLLRIMSAKAKSDLLDAKVIKQYKLMNPEFLLRKFQWFFQLIYSLPGLLAFGVFSFLALSIFWSHREFWIGEWWHHITFMLQNFFWVWLLSFFTIFVHEMGHASACFHFGGKVRRLGFMMFFGFLPAFFADVSDIHFMNLRKRVIVMLAGIFAQAWLWIASMMLWAFTEHGSFINMLAFILCIMNGLGTLFNLIPIFKLDGYYILADIVEIDNLFDRSFRYAKSWFVKTFFIPSHKLTEPDISKREKYWFLGFAFLGVLPILPQLALFFVKAIASFRSYPLLIVALWFLAFASFLISISKRVYSKIQNLSSPSRKSEGPSFWSQVEKKRRWVFAGLALLLFTPIKADLKREAEVVPKEKVIVRSPAKAEVKSVLFSDGVMVKKGDLLVQLEDMDLRKEHASLRSQLAALGYEYILAKRGLSGLAERKWIADISLRSSERSALLTKWRRFNQSRELGLVSDLDVFDLHRDFMDSDRRLTTLESEFNIERAKTGKQETVDLEIQISKMEIDLRRMEKEIDKLKIRAPQDGLLRLTSEGFYPGMVVLDGEVLAEVWTPNLQVKVYVDEYDYFDVRKDSPFKFFGNGIEETLHGKISSKFEVGESSNYTTSNYLAHPQSNYFEIRGDFSSPILYPRDYRYFSTGVIAISADWKPLIQRFLEPIGKEIWVSIWSIM